MNARPQQEKAAARVERRTAERQQNIARLKEPFGLSRADTPDRIAKRIDRVSRYLAREDLPSKPSESAAPTMEVAAETARRRVAAGGGGAAGAAAAAAAGQPERFLEKIINYDDLLDFRYFEDGRAAGLAIGRVHINAASGALEGYGTGSLVSPRLLLTNHHVLSAEDVASVSRVEFNFQNSRAAVQPVFFRLNPDKFWLANEELDFALVAVEAASGALAPFGFNRLIEAEGKVIIGEAVTIIQHPGGETKKVALRNNRIVDVLDLFLHYETDTQPGSSGSPVFNDQWEIVALHHASVRVDQHAELGGYANEGLRVSRLLKFIRDQVLQGDARSFRDQLFDPESTPGVARPPRPSIVYDDGPIERGAQTVGMAADGSFTIRVPVEVTVRLGSGALLDTAVPASAGVVDHEAVSIDRDYTTRKGYSATFLGNGNKRVPLPELSARMLAQAAHNTEAGGDEKHVLPYHHYSVVMNRDRRLAFFTAVNIDGRKSYRIPRDPDRWIFDPRISREEQAGNPIYASNDLDRGHLVRRLDPAWGDDEDVAKVANDDTFHFTNCSPQHKNFNQSDDTWQGLENYILDNADDKNFKVSVFTGPVLADDDDQYRGIQLPREFWKVVAMVKDGSLSATAYLLSQESLLGDLREARRAKESFSYGAYKTFQVSIRKIEGRTGLNFGELKDADPLEGRESALPFRRIARLSQVNLGR